MIRLSNGHEFEYMAASGALGFDGSGWFWEQPLRWLGLLEPKLFTIVLKSLTRYPRKGNLKHLWDGPQTVKFLLDIWRPNGVANAIGLSNMGIENWVAWAQQNKEYLSRGNYISSIYSEDPDELARMAEMLKGLPLKGIEINASCPNTAEEAWKNVDEVVQAVRRAYATCDFPLVLKLSAAQDYKEIAGQLEGMVEAISINSVPWDIAFPHQKSPLARFGGGGVSGKVVQPIVWRMAKELAECSFAPVIAPSSWDFEDMEAVRALHPNIKAISFGSVFLCYPWRPTLYVRKDMRRKTKQPS